MQPDHIFQNMSTARVNPYSHSNMSMQGAKPLFLTRNASTVGANLIPHTVPVLF